MVKRGTRDSAVLGGSTVIRQAAGRGHPNRLIYGESTGAEGDLTVASVGARSQAGRASRVAMSQDRCTPNRRQPGRWNNEGLEMQSEPSSV